MKNLFSASLLFLSFACGSGENTNKPANSESSTATPKKGNSGGSSIIEMDTMHIDTSIDEATDSK